MNQLDYVVHIEEEYGYRDWLWIPDMTVDELKVWWQELPTVAPFFFDGPISFPGEIHQIYFDTVTEFSFAEESDGRVVTRLHSDPTKLPDDVIYMHIHEDEDSFLRIGVEYIWHAGRCPFDEDYGEDYEPSKEARKAWDKAIMNDVDSWAKRVGMDKED